MKKLIMTLVVLYKNAFSVVTSRRRLRDTIRLPLYDNAASMIANSAVGAILNFVYWTVVARFYPAEAVGLSSALFSAVSIIGFIATLGLGYGLIRFLPGAGANRAAMVNSCFTISCIGASVIAGIFLIGLSFWSPALLFVRESAIFIVAFIGATIMVTLHALLDPLLASFRKAKLSTVMTAIQGVFRITLVILMASSFTVFGIFAAWGVAVTAAVILGILLFLPRLMPGYRPLPGLSRQVTSEMVRFSFTSFANTGLWQSTSWLLPLMVVNLIGGEANAYFFIAWGISALLAVIPMSIATSLFVEGSHQDKFLGRDVKRALKLILVLLLPALALMLVIGDKLLLLFGREYSIQGTKVLWVTAMASLPVTVNAIYVAIAQVKKHYRNIIVVAVAIAAGTFILSYVLIPSLGTLGVAIAWLASQSLVALAVLPAFLRALKPEPEKDIRAQILPDEIGIEGPGRSQANLSDRR